MIRLLLLGLLASALSTTALLADNHNPSEKPAGLAVGDTAPAFKAVDQDGKAWSSGHIVGKKILAVYFYPAAMTGGCTKQACAYRDSREALQDLGIEVVGVSGDSPEGLKLFKADSNLNFTLLSDSDGAIAKAFGVPTRSGGEIKRTVGGEEHTLSRGITASRWTFLIGRDGRIVYKDAQVSAAEDAARVIEVVRTMQSGE